MPNVDFRSLALNLIGRNPRVANNPQAQQMLQVIQNGDSARGQEIATNLCNTYGISKEDAVKQAKNFFGIS